MNLLVLCSLWAVVAAYDDLNDTFNITALVEDKEALRTQLLCYLDKGPCNYVNARYKHHFQEAWDDACRECNDIQKHQFKMFFFATKEKFPALFEELSKKYDPAGIHLQNDIQTIKTFN